MAYTREERSASPRSSRSPVRGRRPRRSRSRSPNGDRISNPGNNLYVTGLSTRVTNSDLEKLFGKEGKVVECNLVIDPRSRESRGFAFIAMDSVEDAERCIKNLNRSVLEGRLLTVEKAKRKRGRTPTPGRYQGLRGSRGGGGGGGHGRRRSRSRSRTRSPRHVPDTDSHHRDRRGRSRSPPLEKKTDDLSDLHRRRRERSLSNGRDGHRK